LIKTSSVSKCENTEKPCGFDPNRKYYRYVLPGLRCSAFDFGGLLFFSLPRKKNSI